MLVTQLMKESPASVLPSDSVAQAAKRMKEVGCGILPIIERSATGTRPIGMISDRDIVLRCVAAGRDAQVMTVGEAASEPVICCKEDCSAEEAFHTMRDHNIGRLPVMDRAGALIGIISLADIIARNPKEILNQLPGAKEPLPRKAA